MGLVVAGRVRPGYAKSKVHGRKRFVVTGFSTQTYTAAYFFLSVRVFGPTALAGAAGGA